MNQILINEKLYVTPQLRRKKKMYRINFILSIFLVCILFSYYIYAEYDRTKNEQVSKEIMANLDLTVQEEDDDKHIKIEDNVLVVYFDDNNEDAEEIEIDDLVKDKTSYMYVAEDGKEYQVAATLSIPKIDLNYPVLSSTSDDLLKNGLTKFWGPNANEEGNFVIAGHNYKNKKFFGRLDEMELNDTFELTDVQGNVLTYQIYEIYTVKPEDTNCTTQETDGAKEVTLITCTPTGTERLVIKAREVKK